MARVTLETESMKKLRKLEKAANTLGLPFIVEATDDEGVILFNVFMECAHDIAVQEEREADAIGHHRFEPRDLSPRICKTCYRPEGHLIHKSLDYDAAGEKPTPLRTPSVADFDWAEFTRTMHHFNARMNEWRMRHMP